MKGLILFVLLGFVIPHIHAQDAAFVEQLISQQSLEIGQAAFLLYRSAIADNPPQNIDDSMELLRQRHRRFRNSEASDVIRLADFSLIALNAFHVPGGLMYTLTDFPRYAYREAVYRRLIQGRASPQESLSGDRAFRVVHRLLSQFPPTVFEDTERIRASIRDMQEQINNFGLRVFDPRSFSRGTSILEQADARRETYPAEAFQDYERAETEFRTVVNAGFPVVIEDKRRTAIGARAEAVSERAETSLPEEFSRLESLLAETEVLRRQGLFARAYTQYEDLTQRFLALASITRELREEAERAVDDAETRLQEIRDEE